MYPGLRGWRQSNVFCEFHLSQKWPDRDQNQSMDELQMDYHKYAAAALLPPKLLKPFALMLLGLVGRPSAIHVGMFDVGELVFGRLIYRPNFKVRSNPRALERLVTEGSVESLLV